MAHTINAGSIHAVRELRLDEGPHADASDLLANTGFVGPDASIERLGGGGPGPRSLGLDASALRIGTNGPDTISGGDGPELIDARGGDDVASGFGGDDVVFGGAGDDSLTGDASFVPGGPSFPTGTAGDDVVLGGGGNDTILGDDFEASAFGTTSNLLFGGAGDDSISGGYGTDTVSGGSGDDHIQGWGAPGVGASPGGNEALRGRDLADFLLGGAGDDTVIGGGGDDTIDGGAGDDTITGDVGVDTMTGGAGADRFLFRSTPVFASPDTGQGEGNRDVITDFETGADLLDFTGYLRGDLNVRWEYDAAGDRTVVTYDDPRGAAFFPDLQIELTGVRDLGESDFVFRTPAATDPLA